MRSKPVWAPKQTNKQQQPSKQTVNTGGLNLNLLNGKFKMFKWQLLQKLFTYPSHRKMKQCSYVEKKPQTGWTFLWCLHVLCSSLRILTSAESNWAWSFEALFSIPQVSLNVSKCWLTLKKKFRAKMWMTIDTTVTHFHGFWVISLTTALPVGSVNLGFTYSAELVEAAIWRAYP